MKEIKFIHKKSGITVTGEYGTGYRNITTPYFWLPHCVVEDSNDWEKVKMKYKLFTTFDGVDKFEDDDSFYVDFKNWHHSTIKNLHGNVYANSPNYKFFHSEEKAKEYILQNKPIQVSYKEIMDNLCVTPRLCGKYETVKEFFASKINP